MIICQCAAVSDRDILRAIDHGASTVREICQRTGAGLCCGACRCDVLSLLKKARAERLVANPSAASEAATSAAA